MWQNYRLIGIRHREPWCPVPDSLCKSLTYVGQGKWTEHVYGLAQKADAACVTDITLRLRWPWWMERRWQCFPALTTRRQTFCWRTLEPAEDALVHLWTPRPHFLLPLHRLLPHTAEWPLRRALLIGPRRSRVVGGGRAPSLSVRALFERDITGGRRLRHVYINNEKQHRGRHDETLELSRFQHWIWFPVTALNFITLQTSFGPFISSGLSDCAGDNSFYVRCSVKKPACKDVLDNFLFFFFFPSNRTNQNN